MNIITFVILLTLMGVLSRRLLNLKVLQPLYSHQSVESLIVINSFIKNNSQDLIESLHCQGFRNSQIILIVGGCTQYSAKLYKKHCEICVCYNSFDYTSMIALVENCSEIENLIHRKIDCFFFMHDSCQIGDKFKEKLEMRYCNRTVRLVSTLFYPVTQSMNMGLYKFSDVLLCQDVIVAMKAFPTDHNDIYDIKQQGFSMEDYIFNHLNIHESFTKYLYPFNIKQSKGKFVSIIYISELDIFKIQSNNLITYILNGGWEP